MIRRFLFPGLVILALYYALFGGEYSAFELRGIRSESRESVVRVRELAKLTEELATRAEALESDDRALEFIARENFGMIRDGEILYRFADSGEDEEEEP
ncbi:MAG: septum formation initiator family protein [Gemmatimonadota bacterium]